MDTCPARLSGLGVCENACATPDAYKLKELIEEETRNTRDGGYLRVINTGTIGKYLPKWGLRQMVYLGSRYTRPVVRKSSFLQSFPNTYGKKAVKPKLIIKGLNLLDACLDPDGSTIPGKTTLMITCDQPEGLKLVLGILNSPLAFFYVKQKYPASSYNQGTTFTKEMINDLPVPEIATSDRAKLVSLVDRIIAATQRNAGEEIAALQRDIDRLVYVLYGLTKEEIAIVEGSMSARVASTRFADPAAAK
jgi:hypothetical protein